jgi:hypothetical protein
MRFEPILPALCSFYINRVLIEESVASKTQFNKRTRRSANEAE